MRWTLTLSAAVVLGGETLVARQPLPHSLGFLVTVEEQSAQLNPHRMDQVFDEVRRIWEPYGVDLCISPVTAATCSTRDVIVHVRVGDRRPRPAATTIGWIEFLSDGLPDNVIHVSPAGTLLALEQGRLGGGLLVSHPVPVRERFLAQSMGRAIAHELGHFLLGSKAHTSRGLMRVSLPVTDLLDSGLGRFRLEAWQVSLLAREVPLIAARQHDGDLARAAAAEPRVGLRVP